MATLHVATLTVQRELPELASIYPSWIKTMATLHVATLTVQRELTKLASTLPLYQD